MFQRATRDISVTVEPHYLDDQSSPEESYFFWAYTIQIENKGREVVQLKSRYWRIVDSQGRVQEVRGQGVLDEQPVLRPGERFEYTSGTPLSTPSGFMGGAYQMVTVGGEHFDVEIPVFSLDLPDDVRKLH